LIGALIVAIGVIVTMEGTWLTRANGDNDFEEEKDLPDN
jgi:hypothetical protein